MIIILALRRQNQEDSELDFRLGYIVSSGLAWGYEVRPSPISPPPKKFIEQKAKYWDQDKDFYLVEFLLLW